MREEICEICVSSKDLFVVVCVLVFTFLVSEDVLDAQVSDITLNFQYTAYIVLYILALC